MGKQVNKRGLSEILGVSERTLTEWQKEGMPIMASAELRGQENQYDTEAVVKWYVQRELARAQVMSPRDELDRVRTEREKLQLAKDLRELVPAEDLRPALEVYVDDVIGILEGIPDKYAQPLHMTADVEGKHQLLQQLVREIREGLGSYEFSATLGAGGDSAVPPAA